MFDFENIVCFWKGLSPADNGGRSEYSGAARAIRRMGEVTEVEGEYTRIDGGWTPK